MSNLTHVNTDGETNMVDISEKTTTVRLAEAKGAVHMKPSTITILENGNVEKGNIFETARLAGIMGGKKTSELIPLCHQLLISNIKIKFNIIKDKNLVIVRSEVKTFAQTGVEMEALTAVSIAALTVYDMLKAIDKEIRIDNIHLVKKIGGKSGNFVNKSSKVK